MNGKQKEYLKLKQEMVLGDIEQAKKQIDLYLSDLSFKIDKLKQDFALNNAFNKQDITEIKILINTIEGAE
jgi:hypothetical protein